MKNMITILSLLAISSTSMALDCSKAAEDYARKVSVSLGMDKVRAQGTAHLTESNGAGQYVVYIGSSASYDYHEIELNPQSCALISLKISSGE